MGLILLSLVVVAYLSGITLSVVGTARRAEAAHRAAAVVLSVAWVFHLVVIIRQGVLRGGLPLSNTSEFLLSLGWVVVSSYLLVWMRWKIHVAGLVLPPLALLMVAAAMGLLPLTPEPIADGRRGLFIFHTTVSTLGMAALCVAFAMSLIYLVQDRALKSKNSMRVLERLPSLHACDEIGHHALLWGLPLLTVGILSGVLWNLVSNHRLLVGNAKQTFPLLAWLVFASLVYARTFRGYRGRKLAYWTIAGFALVLLTIVGLSR